MVACSCSRWGAGGGLASSWGRGRELNPGQSVAFVLLPWRGQRAFPSSSSFPCASAVICAGLTQPGTRWGGSAGQLSGPGMAKGTAGWWQLLKGSGGTCPRPSRAPRSWLGCSIPLRAAPAGFLWAEAGEGCRNGDGAPSVGSSSRAHLAHGTFPSLECPQQHREGFC